MPASRKMPSERAIRDYWVEQGLWQKFKSKSMTTVTGYTLIKGYLEEYVCKLEDKGVCMGCGLKTYVMRCHIQPRYAGGPDTVENLHMLCRDCHLASEERSGDEYWEWFYKQDCLANAHALLGRHGISAEKCQRLTDDEISRAMPFLMAFCAHAITSKQYLDKLAKRGIDIAV